MTSLIIPGAELKTKIDTIAKGIAEKPHLLQKLQALKRDDLAFLSEGHEFYPYFLTKLHDFKQHLTDPTNRPPDESVKKDEGVTAASRPHGATADPPRPLTALEKAVAAARAQAALTQDPHPDRFGISSTSTIGVIPAVEMDLMRLAALYAAKAGDGFLELATSRFGNTARDLDFLRTDHPRHRTGFLALRSAYSLVLERPSRTIADLERDCDEEGWLEAILQVCESKKKFLEAEAARRRASLLSEPELRSKLQWSEFTVIGRYSRADLGIVASSDRTTEAPVSRSSVAQPRSNEHPRVVSDSYEAKGKPQMATNIAFRDASGALIAAEAATEVMKSQLVAPQEHTDKRAPRSNGLADEDELKRNLEARYNATQTGATEQHRRD